MKLSAEVSVEFPSLIEDNAIGPSPYQAAQFHIRQLLQALSELSPGRDRDKRQVRSASATSQ